MNKIGTKCGKFTLTLCTIFTILLTFLGKSCNAHMLQAQDVYYSYMASGPNFEFKKVMHNFWHQGPRYLFLEPNWQKLWIYKNVSRIIKIVHSASNYFLHFFCHFYPIFLTTCALLELPIQRTMSIDTILLVELSVLYPWLRYHWPSLVFPNDWISSNASSVNVQFFHQNFLCECNISTGK